MTGNGTTAPDPAADQSAAASAKPETNANTATASEPSVPTSSDAASPATGKRTPVVAVIGNPNVGKSTLFNALTGMRQRVGNYPGVTVEKHVGKLPRLSGEGYIELVDLPGTYSLAANSPDEMVTIDVLFGRIAGEPRPSAILVVLDGSNLRRNLFLASQAVETRLPIVFAVSMMDQAAARGITLRPDELAEAMPGTFVPVVAPDGTGIDKLREEIEAVADGHNARAVDCAFSVLDAEFRERCRELAESWSTPSQPVHEYEVMRAAIDAGAYTEKRLIERLRAEGRDEPVVQSALQDLRERFGEGKTLAAADTMRRYRMIGEILERGEARDESKKKPSASDKLDKILTHPISGSVIFIGLMAVVFQSIFAWAGPLMDLIDGAFGDLGAAVAGAMGEGALSSLLADGVIAGVGAVVIFLPQILILFAFIIVLEDSGYMARAAFLMDRVMRWCGLSGQSFVPMLSSFACAVPGIMATRTIPDRRDRLATILAAPFMTCSARLPVYILLIGTFVPNETYAGGWINLHGLVMLGLYVFGAFGGVFTAFLLKKTLLRGPTPTFLMELPPYRWPRVKLSLMRLWDRARAFLVRAGTIIFAVTVIVWALAYFPRPDEVGDKYDAMRADLEADATVSRNAAPPLIDEDGEELEQPSPFDERMTAIDNAEAQAYLEASYFGQLGHAVEPIFKPLGWDWRVSVSVLASFPAREVVIAVMGTTFSLGGDVDEEDEGLKSTMKGATWPDGKPLFTLASALSLMVFFALCLQCGATVATIRREANSWKWAIFAWLYMTGLGYVAALITYQVGSALLG